MDDHTLAQRLGNWWHYHKWLVLLAAALLGTGGVLFAGWAGQTQPDLRVGYVAAQALDQDAAARLQTALESLCEDSNGDGQVLVALEQYVISFNGTASDANTQIANMARLSADLRAVDGPAIFLLDDPLVCSRASARCNIWTVPSRPNRHLMTRIIGGRWSLTRMIVGCLPKI